MASEKHSAKTEYDRKVRERERREQNYKKLKAFTETQAKQAKRELEACYEEIEELYRNRIVVYENTDDEYKKTAVELYRQRTDFGEKLSNFGVKSAKTVWNVGRGALAAVLDLVKTALAIQDLKNTLDTLPLAVVTEVMGIEVPGLSLAKVDDLKNMAYGAVAVLQNPARVLAAFGQKIGDTVEEEGIAYSISYVAADVAIQVLLSKGLGEVKNVSKADDLVDVARTVDTLDDAVKIADELTDVAKAVDQVGDIKDVAMAVNVVDETNAVVKAVDEVNDVADAAKTVEKLDGVIESGRKTIDYIKLSDELGRKIENDGYKIIDIKDAAIANAEWADMGYDLPPVAAGTKVYNVAAGNFQYARVFKEGVNKPKSPFILRADDIQGLSAIEIAEKYALPQTPDKIVYPKIPSDVPLEISIVGPQKTWGTLGGDAQYAIKEVLLDDDWFTDIHDLK